MPRTTAPLPALRTRRGLAGHAVRFLGPFEPARAMAETALMLSVLPPLLIGPRPDDHPVLVIPGVSGGPLWCAALRTFLRARGHTVHQPGTGAMRGRPGHVASRLTRQVECLAGTSGPVSIVGWSVGGCFARQVALAVPDSVRQVVTLGTPAGGFWYHGVPRTSYRPMAVPTTSIFSRFDPMFEGHDCRQPAAPRCEDVEIVSSHMGMATNPLAYHVVADRIGQPAGAWQPYTPAYFLPVESAPSRGEPR